MKKESTFFLNLMFFVILLTAYLIMFSLGYGILSNSISGVDSLDSNRFLAFWSIGMIFLLVPIFSIPRILGSAYELAKVFSELCEENEKRRSKVYKDIEDIKKTVEIIKKGKVSR